MKPCVTGKKTIKALEASHRVEKLIEWEATHIGKELILVWGQQIFHILNWAMVFWMLSKAALKQQVAGELPLVDEMGLSALKAVKLLMQ